MSRQMSTIPVSWPGYSQQLGRSYAGNPRKEYSQLTTEVCDDTVTSLHYSLECNDECSFLALSVTPVNKKGNAQCDLHSHLQHCPQTHIGEWNKGMCIHLHPFGIQSHLSIDKLIHQLTFNFNILVRYPLPNFNIPAS